MVVLHNVDYPVNSGLALLVFIAQEQGKGLCTGTIVPSQSTHQKLWKIGLTTFCGLYQAMSCVNVFSSTVSLAGCKTTGFEHHHDKPSILDKLDIPFVESAQSLRSLLK
jgi:hypothetical protein